MKTILKLSLLFLVLVPLAHAQGPIIAGAGPVVEAGVGYSYLRSDVPSEGWLGMNGILLSGNADFSRRFGVRLELGYSRSFDAFNTGRTTDMLTYMAGPIFYPVRHRHFSVYTQALFGGARQTGVNESDGVQVLGFVNKFAWSGGAGIQYRFDRSLSIRAGADYLHTQFFNSNVAIQGENNLRPSVSLIYTFGEHE